MKVTYQHEVTTSFVLWFDNFLLSKGSAYRNITSPMYYQTDDRLPNNTIYASPHKQWVNDSSIEGAQIPIGITRDGSLIKRGTNGLKLDFENGRAILDSSFPTTASLTSTFAIKDFNIYVTDQNEEDLIIESNHKINSRFFRENAGIPPYDQVVPAIFISNDGSRNDPFAFGGEDKTTCYFKAAVIAENLYTLDGVLSIFNDANRTIFNKINFNDHPTNEFGDLKNGLKIAVPVDKINTPGNVSYTNTFGSTYQAGGEMAIRSEKINVHTKLILTFTSSNTSHSFDFNQNTNTITINYPRYSSTRRVQRRNVTRTNLYLDIGTDPAIDNVVNFINSQEGFSASHNATSKIDSHSLPGLVQGTYNTVIDPLNTPPYNYNELADKNKEDYFLIESVSCSRMTDNLRKVVLDNLFVGFIDFEIAQTRFPRL